MTLSKFLTYWSLLFAILTIWGFSILVALADVKDELRAAFRRRWAALARGRLALTDPLAGRTPAETMTSRPMTEGQTWLLREVEAVSGRLGLRDRTLVVQDTFGHYVVYLSHGKRLVTYRLDRPWVDEARGGNAEQLERIRKDVEQYLRRDVLGERPAPAPAPSADAASAPATAAAPAGMSREERIAAAKAKAEALKAERAAAGGTSSPTPAAGSEPPASGEKR